MPCQLGIPPNSNSCSDRDNMTMCCCLTHFFQLISSCLFILFTFHKWRANSTLLVSMWLKHHHAGVRRRPASPPVPPDVSCHPCGNLSGVVLLRCVPRSYPSSSYVWHSHEDWADTSGMLPEADFQTVLLCITNACTTCVRAIFWKCFSWLQRFVDWDEHAVGPQYLPQPHHYPTICE